MFVRLHDEMELIGVIGCFHRFIDTNFPQLSELTQVYLHYE